MKKKKEKKQVGAVLQIRHEYYPLYHVNAYRVKALCEKVPTGSATSRCSHCKFTSVVSKWRTKWNTNSTHYTTVQMLMKLYQLSSPLRETVLLCLIMASDEMKFVFHDWNVAMCNRIKLNVCVKNSFVHPVFKFSDHCEYTGVSCSLPKPVFLWSPQCLHFLITVPNYCISVAHSVSWYFILSILLVISSVVFSN